MDFLEISLFCAAYLFCLLGPSVLLDLFSKGAKVPLNERLIFSLVVFLFIAEVAVHVGSMQILIAFYYVCMTVYLFISVIKMLRLRVRWDSHWTSAGLSVLMISGFVGLYTMVFGVYGEVPADVYAHLGSIYESSRFGQREIIDLSHPWYVLMGGLVGVAGIEGQEFLLVCSLVSPALFLLLMKEVAEEIFRSAISEKQYRSLVVWCALILTVLFFGTSIFSYWRYYVLSPAYLMYPVFIYCGYLCIQQFFGGNVERSKLGVAITIGLGLLVSFKFHKQECLFLILVIWSCSALALVNRVSKYFQRGRPPIERTKVKNSCFFIAALFVFVVVLPVYLYLGSPAVTASDVFKGNTIDLGGWTQLRDAWIIADPSGRVFETLGLFGCLTVIGYLLLIPARQKSTYLALLVLIPPVFAFNPFFVRVFLDQADPTVLWRLFYMAPIGFVGAHLMYSLIKIQRMRLLRYIVLSTLVGSLVPLKGVSDYQHLKYPTLGKIPENRSHENWSDLLDFLQDYHGWKIVTDPVTGYVVSGLSNVQHWHFKFTPGERYHEFNKTKYLSDSFLDYGNGKWLFIVNLRDGGLSENGELSGHWPSRIMQVSDHYSKKYLDYLGVSKKRKSKRKSDAPIPSLEPPLIMEQVWQQDRIWVFKPTLAM